MKKTFLFLTVLAATFLSCRKDPVPDIPTPHEIFIAEGQTNWTKIPYRNFQYDLEGGLGLEDQVIEISDMYFNDQTGFLTGCVLHHEWRGSMFHRTDDSTNFEEVVEPWQCGLGGYWIEAAYFISPTRVIVVAKCTDDEEILQTTNGGASWWTCYTSENTGTYHNRSPRYMIDSQNIFYRNVRTNNGGATWQNVNVIPGTRCYYFADTTYGVCGTEFGIIAETFDCGLTWDTLYNQPGESFSCITMTGAQTILAGGSKILKSTNAGANWTEVYATPAVMDMIFVSVNIGFAATVSGGSVSTLYSGDILKTTDGGNTWTVNYHSDFIGFNCLYAEDDQTIYAAGYQTDNDTNLTKAYYIKTTTQGD